MNRTVAPSVFVVSITLALLVGTAMSRARPAVGDGGNAATTTEAVAKQLEDEFNELGKKKETIKGVARRMEILKELQKAPGPTAFRFLGGLFKKSSAPGDERLYALLSLVRMADAKTWDEAVATLVREKDATLWQAVGDAAGSEPSDAVHAWIVGPGLASAQPEAACACLEAIRRHPEPSVAEKVEALYAKHAKAPAPGTSVDVACLALRALSPTGGPTVRALLLEAGKHADARLRAVAADAIPALEPFDAEAEAATRALLGDESATVRQAAATVCGTAKRLPVANALIGLLGDPRVRTRHVASVALTQISGASLGHDAKAWAAWLEKKEPGKPNDVTVPTYHGFSVYSDRVVFLVDGSGSMEWPFPFRNKPVHRIDVARSELASVLRQLTPDTLFNVIVFAEKPVAWKKGEAPASPENVNAALSWAERSLAKPEGDTHFYEALDAAYANNPQFDTIYLLTDGNPTSGKYWSNEGLLASVRAWTRHRRTAIHTIGLSLANEDRGMPNLTENLYVMEQLLKSLADATSGEFRKIEQAPPKK